ncbi:MAG: gamma-glutamyltransferase [Candidatus Lokiarchaeota archaeon]|nr:gamma-glutamyltransferase [Candidatus Lokiarchaeota archaeon]
MGIPFRFEEFFRCESRRSPVLALRGIVASSHPLATQAGLEILQKGGNAADAAVACAAALNVVEPMSTGIGGDCFALFYDAKLKRVLGMNGSGRAPKGITIDDVRRAGVKGNSIPSSSPHSVTVPGCVAGWVDAVEQFGRLPVKDVLGPAIKLAFRGHPVAPLIALAWSTGVGKLKRSEHGGELLVNGAAPEPGQVFRNRFLSKVLDSVAEHGKAGFYEGWVAKAIVDTHQAMGGKLTLDDLKAHSSTLDTPITIKYRGIDVHEIPPNGQGITALIALNLLEEFDLAGMDPGSPEYYHLLIESLRLAFADARAFVADPAHSRVPVDGLLSKAYAAERRKLIDRARARLDATHGSPEASSDTVYLAAADGDGNACSFINSNYEAFGTGIVPSGTGFVLQNRGSNFVLDPTHPNGLEPGKRPYHTIIPAMATRDGELWAAFGVMGGFMQPQGHVQVFLRMAEHEYDPQAALDAARFCIEGGNAGGAVMLEESIVAPTRERLASMGHHTKLVSGFGRSVFGRGQVIRRDPDTGVLWAGSDPRSDGCAFGY